MPKPSPELVEQLHARLVQFRSDFDAPFLDFVKAARRVLPQHSEEARFTFVVYRIWRERGRWRSWGWDELLVEGYPEVEGSFAWTPEEVPDWVSQHLIERTLSVWQPRYPGKLTARSAVQILHNATEATSADGGVA